ncbi:MAG: dipeptide ABC transporter ATP-binding protein [SAR324 cluster bacterium]|nr:dipeptide ABC transporter ATP-binding protein [SAR324 cluster bacterium]
MSLLEIKNLTVEFGSIEKPFRAVDAVNLRLDEGEVLGIVGESGSGKSVSALATMGLIEFPGRVRAEELKFQGRDLLRINDKQRRSITGADIAMIFQEPMTSLNPCFTVGYQIIETLKVHQPDTRKQMKARAVELLEQVGIPDPVPRLKLFPHQLSGGMSQRVMIAIAIACNPRLLIADEPTTALDVTIQAQIMDLLLELQEKSKMGMVLISHDLALIAEAAGQVVVMYAGQVVEIGTAEELFYTPKHPYTAALINSLPEHAKGKKRLDSLAGVVPGMYDRPSGCLLNPRCQYATDRCRNEEPELKGPLKRQVKCHTPLGE